MAAPSDRLIFVPMIGFAPLIAAAILRGRASTVRVRRVGANVLAAGALIFSPLFLLVMQRGFGQQMIAAREIVENAEIEPQVDRDLIVLQAPFATMMLALRALHDQHMQAPHVRFWPLQYGRRPLRLTRPSEDVLVVRSLGEAFVTRPFEFVYREDRGVPEPGRTYASGLFRARVDESDEAGVVQFTLTLNEGDSGRFDDPSVGLLRWDGEGLVRFPMPAVGETVELEESREPFPFAP